MRNLVICGVITMAISVSGFQCAQRNPIEDRPVAAGTPIPADLSDGSTNNDINWGGLGISMMVNQNSVTMEFDCADATINAGLKVDASGKFVQKGELTSRRPGPERADRPPVEPRAVNFEGKIAGKAMTVRMTDEKTGELLGSYTLENGKAGRLRRCL